jgi:UDP-glucose 4-epimerase
MCGSGKSCACPSSPHGVGLAARLLFKHLATQQRALNLQNGRGYSVREVIASAKRAAGLLRTCKVLRTATRRDRQTDQ